MSRSEEKIILTDEDLAEFDKKARKAGISEEALAKFNKVDHVRITSLPKKGTFLYYEYNKNLDNPEMSHVRIYAENGYSISLSELTRKCLFGKENLENPLFESSTKSFHKGNAILANIKCISPELEAWIISNEFTSQRSVAKKLIGKSFNAIPIEVAYYYPDNEESRIKRSEISKINKPENLNQRISRIKFTTLYRVILD